MSYCNRVAGLVAILLSAVLWVGQASAANVWHQSAITSIYSQSDGRVVLTFLSDAPTCPNPNSPKKNYYISVGDNGVTLDGLKNMFALALTAAASRLTVNFVFDDSSTGCFINRMSVPFPN